MRQSGIHTATQSICCFTVVVTNLNKIWSSSNIDVDLSGMAFLASPDSNGCSCWSGRLPCAFTQFPCAHRRPLCARSPQLSWKLNAHRKHIDVCFISFMLQWLCRAICDWANCRPSSCSLLFCCSQSKAISEKTSAAFNHKPFLTNNFLRGGTRWVWIDKSSCLFKM